MKENHQHLINNSILNRIFTKKKIPNNIDIKYFEKENINQMNKSPFIFYKKIKAKQFNTRNKDYGNDFYQNQDINIYRLSNGMNKNSQTYNNSSYSSFLSNINNNSIAHNLQNFVNQKKLKNILNLKINNNKEIKKRNISNENKRNCCSYNNPNIKKGFDFDEYINIINPYRKSMPKKYDNIHSSSYENKNMIFYNNTQESEDEVFNKIDKKLLFVLKNLKIEKFYEIFIKNGIFFKDLFLLNKEDLIEIKIPIGPRNRLLYFINIFNRISKNYDFDELYTFFKVYNDDDKENNKSIENITNIKKKIIPRPNVNLYKKLNKIKNIEIQKNKNLNIKVHNNIIKNKNYKNKDLENLVLEYKPSSSRNEKKNNFEDSLINLNYTEIFSPQNYILNNNTQNNFPKNKKKPQKIIIDNNIDIIKKLNKINSFYAKSQENNNNEKILSFYKTKKDISRNIKNKNHNICPIPKKPNKINSPKYMNSTTENINFNKNTSKNILNERTLYEKIRKIKI